MKRSSSSPILSPARARLVQLMHDLGYGRIADLPVRDGEPVFDPPPVVKRIYQFGKEAGSRTAVDGQNLVLKRKVQDLLEVMDRERSLHIEELKIEDGLPVAMIVMKSGRA